MQVDIVSFSEFQQISDARTQVGAMFEVHPGRSPEKARGLVLDKIEKRLRKLGKSGGRVVTFDPPQTATDGNMSWQFVAGVWVP